MSQQPTSPPSAKSEWDNANRCFVFGIISTILAIFLWYPILANVTGVPFLVFPVVVTPILGIIGIVFYKRAKRSGHANSKALIGLICSIIGLIYAGNFIYYGILLLLLLYVFGIYRG